MYLFFNLCPLFGLQNEQVIAQINVEKVLKTFSVLPKFYCF